MADVASFDVLKLSNMGLVICLSNPGSDGLSFRSRFLSSLRACASSQQVLVSLKVSSDILGVIKDDVVNMKLL